MKTKELSKILNLIDDILSFYQDEEITDVLLDLKKLKLSAKENNHSTGQKITIDDKQLKESIDKFSADIDSFGLSDIEKRLTSEDEFPAMEYIRYFAKKIGLDLGTRLSRNNSIHTITRHLERMRIDNTISKRRD